MQIAILGGGLMGQAVAEHLLAENHSVHIYNRTPDKIASLAKHGATVCKTPQQAVEQADFVLLLLSDAEAILTVLTDIEPQSLQNRLLIQMGTIAPAESQDIEQRLSRVDAAYLECPVLGSLPEARSGSLILMAGGNEESYQRALPLLKVLGKQPRHIGPTGQGAAVKLAMNQLIAGLTATFALSLNLIEQYDIDTEQFMEIVRESALYAPTYDKKLKRMLDRDFANPNFPTKHLAKDTRLFLNVAESLHLNASGLQGISELLDEALALGLENTDYSALFAAISPDRK